MNFPKEEFLITIIDALLTQEHQRLLITTLYRSITGKLEIRKKGLSSPRQNKYIQGVDSWCESIDSWLLDVNKTNIKHYICVKRLPKWSVWSVWSSENHNDEQEIRDSASIERILRMHKRKFPKNNLTVLSYWKNDDFIESVQEFIDQKEVEHFALLEACKKIKR